jgi:hypothetical protein
VRDRALLLGVHAGGEDHVGLLLERLAAEAREGDHRRRIRQLRLGGLGLQQ